MKVIVFGATGYLGSHVAEQLLLAGHNPLCVVRKNAKQNFLHSMNAKLHIADFNHLDAIAALIDAETIVINCIADTRSHASYAQRKKTDIDLSRDLFLLAQQQQAKRFIQLSTVMVYGFARPATAINENHAKSPQHIYNQIAADREQALLDAYQEGNTQLIILRPSNSMGKRDTAFLPNFINARKYGVFPVVDGGQWCFSCIDARDIGSAMVHLLGVAVDQPEVFLVKGFDTDWLSFKAELDNYLGKKTRTLNMPKSLLSKLAGFFEWLVPYGKNPPITRFDLDVLSTHTLFDDKKIRLTGFEPKYQLTDSLKDALERH